MSRHTHTQRERERPRHAKQWIFLPVPPQPPSTFRTIPWALPFICGPPFLCIAALFLSFRDDGPGEGGGGKNRHHLDRVGAFCFDNFALSWREGEEMDVTSSILWDGLLERLAFDLGIGFITPSNSTWSQIGFADQLIGKWPAPRNQHLDCSFSRIDLAKIMRTCLTK